MSVKRATHTIDAMGQAPGRMATKIATLLMGKHKVGYQTHLDHGDKVVVINADKLVFSGKKMDQKIYRHHTNHPGGLKEIPARKIFLDKPEQIIISAVIKMIPKNKLRNDRMKRLKFKQ